MNADDEHTSWAMYVTTLGDNGQYTTNALRYATEQEAKDAGAELSSRWFAVIAHKAAPTSDPVNCRFIDGRNVMLEENDGTE